MPRKAKPDRPLHSKLGASSAERWINCSASVGLIAAVLPEGEQEDDEFRAEGKLAHALGAHCLETGQEPWEAMGRPEFAAVDMPMTQAVGVYLDYANPRMRKGNHQIERQVEHTHFSEYAYGQLDLVIDDPEPNVAVELIDYKNGVGEVVDVEGNVQLRCYAYYYIDGDGWPAKKPRLGDMAFVKLTIVQPNGFHADGPIRSEVIRVGELRNWAYNVLHDAMRIGASALTEPRTLELTYKMGGWCHFCPVKLHCPEMRKNATDAAFAVGELERMSAEPLADGLIGEPAMQLAKFDDEWLGQWYGRMQQLDYFKKAIRDEVAKRAMKGAENPNWKLVYAKVDRQFKPEAFAPQTDPDFPDVMMPAPIDQYFGEAAWLPRERPSPSMIEKLPGGKQFCAEYAQKPKAGLTVAPSYDKRTAQKPITDEEVFAKVDLSAVTQSLTPTAEEW